MFTLTFLGTSAGIPTKSRNMSALAIECINPYQSRVRNRQTFQRPWILIDCGEGTQHQLLQTKLSLRQLAMICITHVHGDHCYGLPGLLASMAMSSRRETLILMAPRAIEHFLNTLISTTQLQLGFRINFVAIEDCLSEKAGKFSLALGSNHQLTLVITALSHRVPSYAFSITQEVEKHDLNKQKLMRLGIPPGPIWGELQAGKDIKLSLEELVDKYGQSTLMAKDFMSVKRTKHKIVVAGDNDRPELLQDAVTEAQLLVHEATYTQEVKERILSKAQNDPQQAFNPMHTSAQEIARFAKAMKLNNLILTHFSARYQLFDNPNSKVSNMSAIRLEVEQSYQGNYWLAHDFAQFNVDKTVQLISD